MKSLSSHIAESLVINEKLSKTEASSKSKKFFFKIVQSSDGGMILTIGAPGMYGKTLTNTWSDEGTSTVTVMKYMNAGRQYGFIKLDKYLGDKAFDLLAEHDSQLSEADRKDFVELWKQFCETVWKLLQVNNGLV